MCLTRLPLFGITVATPLLSITNRQCGLDNSPRWPLSNLHKTATWKAFTDEPNSDKGIPCRRNVSYGHVKCNQAVMPCQTFC